MVDITGIVGRKGPLACGVHHGRAGHPSPALGQGHGRERLPHDAEQPGGSRGRGLVHRHRNEKALLRRVVRGVGGSEPRLEVLGRVGGIAHRLAVVHPAPCAGDVVTGVRQCNAAELIPVGGGQPRGRGEDQSGFLDARRGRGLVAGGSQRVVSRIRTAQSAKAQVDGLIVACIGICKGSGGGDAQRITLQNPVKDCVVGLDGGVGVAVIHLARGGDAGDGDGLRGDLKRGSIGEHGHPDIGVFITDELHLISVRIHLRAVRQAADGGHDGVHTRNFRLAGLGGDGLETDTLIPCFAVGRVAGSQVLDGV